MKLKSLHRIISVWCVLIALLPMSVQFAHAMDNHSHEVCELNYVKHYHNNDLDCDFNHFLFNSNVPLFADEIQLQDDHGFNLQPQFKATDHVEWALLTTKSRGPPSYII